MIDYTPLFTLLAERGISKNTLSKDAEINWRTLDNMKDGKPVSLTTIEKICVYLEVPIDRIVKIGFK